MADRDVLQKAGDPKPGQDYEKLYRTVRDSVLLNHGATLEDEILFTSATKNRKYKTPGFPSQSQAFKIIGVRVTPYIRFALGAADADGEAQAEKFAAFMSMSRFSFKLEGNDVFDEYLESFANFDFKPSLPVASAKAWVETRSKVTNMFKLPIPVTIGAGKTFEFEFRPLKLTTQAADVAAMDLPDAGLTSDKGYAIFFDLITDNVKGRG